MNRVAITFAFFLLAAPTPAADAPLRVGFGEIDVTPKLDKKKPVYLAGFGHDRKATGVHDPIMARAVVLAHGDEKIALVSVDVIGLFFPLVESVRKQLPGFKYVLVSSTHNHEGPDTIGMWGSSPFVSGLDAAYLNQIEAGIVSAVKSADAALKPARAEIGTASAPELIHDGREPFIKHDELVAIRFLEPDGKSLIGMLVQWNCHPETLDDKNTEISADYVATTVSTLRKKHGDRPVVYLTGTVGGLMTSLKVEIKGPKGELLKDGTFEKTEEFGRRVAEAAVKALEAAKPVSLTPFTVRTQALLLPMENRMYQLGWSIGVLKRTAYRFNGDPFSKERIEGKDVKGSLGVATEIGYVKLGDLEVATIPGEIYPELVLGKVQDPVDPGADFPDAPIEPAIYAQMKGKHRMLIGLANDEIGYIIPKRQWDEKKPFCYGRPKAQYGEVNSIGPDAAPILCEAFRRLAAGEKQPAR